MPCSSTARSGLVPASLIDPRSTASTASAGRGAEWMASGQHWARLLPMCEPQGGARRAARRARWRERLVAWGLAGGIGAAMVLAPQLGEARSSARSPDAASADALPSAGQAGRQTTAGLAPWPGVLGAPVAPPATVHAAQQAHRAHRAWTPDPFAPLAQRVQTLNAMGAALARAPGSQAFEAEPMASGSGSVAIHLSDDASFAPSSADIPSRAEPVLDALAVALNAPVARQLVVRVIGHTDSTGPDGANAMLSYSRAEQVALALAARGVPRERLVLRAAGEARPEASNRRASGRELNRRVELQLVPPARLASATD